MACISMRATAGWGGQKNEQTRSNLRFATPNGEITVAAQATVLALGGGSWARLGSDGAWMDLLAERQVATQTLRPANCGFETHWSP